MKRGANSREVLIVAIALLGMSISALHAQTVQEGTVGVNTDTPQITFDVTGFPSDASRFDGVRAPRITGEQLRAKAYTADQDGAIVYVTNADPDPAGQTQLVKCGGYYYFSKILVVVVHGYLLSRVARFQALMTVATYLPPPPLSM